MGSYIQPGFAANQVGMPTYLERGMERSRGSEHQELGLFDILSSLHNRVSSNLALDHDGIMYAIEASVIVDNSQTSSLEAFRQANKVCGSQYDWSHWVGHHALAALIVRHSLAVA